ncbi:hypothetical protein GCM10009839_00360 [Catenulispora yoronensis]|uniref:AB hydrolase-1 domain-containing protein n=1 Tax=Catenulispora yoronensis TaxID=450799 RepID=A0ABN2TIF4_9ACTN
MKTVRIDDIDIEYEDTGAGEPSLLIHGSNLATGLAPLAAALATATPHRRLLRYHRRGMAGSGGRTLPIGVERQATDALALLDALGLDSAHLVGYSYGGVIALETTLTAPERVRSLILLEPILMQVPGGTEFASGMTKILDLYAEGDLTGAVTATFAGLGGPDWQDLVATAGPNALDQAVRDTELFYQDEWPALNTWTLDTEAAGTYPGPVLSVVGTESGPFFQAGRTLLHKAFNTCTDADIPGANHLLNLQAPERIGAAIAAFDRASNQ